MGWLHINNTGQGIYLNKDALVQNINNFENLKININQHLLKKLTNKLPNIRSFSYVEKLLILGIIKNEWYDITIKNNYDKITKEYLQQLEEDEIANLLVDTISILFCEKYNYPYEAFRSVVDYNDDAMFFCLATLPIKPGFEALSYFTEQKYLCELNAFFRILIPEWQDIEELDYCEEYVKE